MSRNLGQTHCDYCLSEVVCVEAARPITKEEAGPYFAEYEGMLVANAECPLCLAKYLAWVDETHRKNRQWSDYYRRPVGLDARAMPTPVDLSFRSSFNDEPGDDDLPEYDVVQCRVKYGEADLYDHDSLLKRGDHD